MCLEIILATFNGRNKSFMSYVLCFAGKCYLKTLIGHLKASKCDETELLPTAPFPPPE
jgi:hypothetical protein